MSEWKDIKEELPEDGVDVLFAFYGNPDIFIGRLDTKGDIVSRYAMIRSRPDLWCAIPYPITTRG